MGGMMEDNKITLKRPKWANGQLFVSAITVDSNGMVTPVFYEHFLKCACKMGWKQLSRVNTDTETTEIWELPREPFKHREV